MENISDSRISFEDVLEFWKSFLPTYVSKEQLINEVEKITGYNINEIEKKYTSENPENVSKYFDSKYTWDNEDGSFYLSNNIWFGFYAPILNIYYTDLCNHINHSKIISNKKQLIRSVVNQLLEKCNQISFRTLILETNIAKEEGKLIGDGPVEKGKYFSEMILADKQYVLQLYHIYPELIRCLKIQIENRVNFVKEVILKIEENKISIKKHFGETGCLVDISFGKGDTHNNGRMVCKLIFDNINLIYKPRRLEMEEQYVKLVQWINSQQIPDFKKLKACKCFSENSCGWMEFVTYKKCCTEEEICDFYTRIGELLCLLHVLNGKDMHYENIIADRDQPVLIDLETLLHAELVMDNETLKSLNGQIGQVILNSVNSISLLPTYMTGKNKDKAINIGGVSQGTPQIAPFKDLFIKNYDTDEIQLVYDYGVIAPAQNNPALNNKNVNPEQYADYIKKGFTCLYKWMQQNKEEFTLFFKKNLYCKQVRHVLRPTNVYSRLLSTSYHPDLLHSTLDRYVFLMWLRFQLDEEIREQDIAALKIEYNSLSRGDIPYFFTYTDSKNLFSDNEFKIEDYFTKTICETIEAKVESIGTDDFRRQMAFINASYRFSDKKQHLTQTVFQSPAVYQSDYKVLKKHFTEKAIEIADLISRKAIYGKSVLGKPAASWIGISITKSKVDMMGPAGNDLYDGNSGIALFYAILYKVTADEKWLNMVYMVLEPIKDVLDNPDEHFEKFNLGAFSGMFGWLYAMQKIADVLNDTNMYLYIEDKLPKLFEQLYKCSNSSDVISGYAGILSLTLFWLKKDIIEENTAKQFFVYILNKILESAAIDDKTNGYMWEGEYSSYAHGNAGISAQLAKLYEITGERKILGIIRKCLDYERSLFDSEQKAWLRRSGSKEIQYTWCNGAIGILLNRIQLLECGYIDEYIEDELRYLVSICKEHSMGKGMCLCHGDVGNILIIKYVAKYLGDTALENECILTMQYFMEHSLNLVQLEEEEEWGLLTGAAGIGLGLLSTLEDNFVIDILRLE